MSNNTVECFKSVLKGSDNTNKKLRKRETILKRILNSCLFESFGSSGSVDEMDSYAKEEKFALRNPPNPVPMATTELRAAAERFVTFLNKAVTPFHAVRELSHRLKENGFHELRESDEWRLQPNGKYYVTKNDSTIFAFAVGAVFTPGSGFSMVVGHSDSPSLRLKPVTKDSANKFLQVGVSTYGGGIWRSWFDRDLAIAGQVIVHRETGLQTVLIDSREPVLFIPNLAIHLEPNREKQSCNNETELKPILCTEIQDQLAQLQPITPPGTNPHVVDNHHTAFLHYIANLAGVPAESIVDLDLYLYDSAPAAVTGIYKEFISGQRLDNLVGAYTAIEGLITSLADGPIPDGNVRVAAAYDNEEVGSASAQGADSNWNEWCLRRIFTALSADAGPLASAFERGVANSMIVSADQAHACHPNFAARHEAKHTPAFHGGVVVKINHNQRYATTATTHAILKEVAHVADVPLQQFVVRNDCSCGSTVGPMLTTRTNCYMWMLATKLGVRTVDVGCPQLAMHSIREFADTSSIGYATKLYSEFYRRFPTIVQAFN